VFSETSDYNERPKIRPEFSFVMFDTFDGESLKPFNDLHRQTKAQAQLSEVLGTAPM